MLTLTDISELKDRVGQDLGTSGWHEVTQDRITAFAHATDDFEQIHLDDARGKEVGLGGTIAHGLYTARWDRSSSTRSTPSPDRPSRSTTASRRSGSSVRSRSTPGYG